MIMLIVTPVFYKKMRFYETGTHPFRMGDELLTEIGL